MIIDTDVLIWFLRGNQKAIDFIADATPFSISIVTYMELVRGMRDKRELAKMKKAFAEMGVEIIPCIGQRNPVPFLRKFPREKHMLSETLDARAFKALGVGNVPYSPDSRLEEQKQGGI